MSEDFRHRHNFIARVLQLNCRTKSKAGVFGLFLLIWDFHWIGVQQKLYRLRLQIKGIGIMADFTNTKIFRYVNRSDKIESRDEAVELPDEWITTCFQPSADRIEFAKYARSRGSIKLEDVLIERRIGSASMNAMVYEGSVDGQRVAVKFMPRVYRDGWEDEILIAKKLSDMVLEDLGLPFPIVVGSGSTKIKLRVDFPGALRASQETARREAIANGKTRRESLDEAQSTTEIADEVFASYLISELASSDLASVVDPLDYREEMMCALRALHSAGYVHGDAHLGNFLLTRNNEVLIHDFGDAVENTSSDAFNSDFEKLDQALSKADGGFGSVFD